ncbi:hypothetical protein ACH5RR_037807 [Cinchona calisaya]|uniref:Uncharacterized protein n=1 Tax=Cinchona calisaya TaxID=153742 RepID=A0ABD2YCS1_9GENT
MSSSSDEEDNKRPSKKPKTSCSSSSSDHQGSSPLSTTNIGSENDQHQEPQVVGELAGHHHQEPPVGVGELAHQEQADADHHGGRRHDPQAVKKAIEEGADHHQEPPVVEKAHHQEPPAAEKAHHQEPPAAEKAHHQEADDHHDQGHQDDDNYFDHDYPLDQQVAPNDQEPPVAEKAHQEADHDHQGSSVKNDEGYDQDADDDFDDLLLDQEADHKGKAVTDKGKAVTDKGKAVIDKGKAVIDKGKAVVIDKGKAVVIDKGKAVVIEGNDDDEYVVGEKPFISIMDGLLGENGNNLLFNEEQQFTQDKCILRGTYGFVTATQTVPDPRNLAFYGYIRSITRLIISRSELVARLIYLRKDYYQTAAQSNPKVFRDDKHRELYICSKLIWDI